VIVRIRSQCAFSLKGLLTNSDCFGLRLERLINPAGLRYGGASIDSGSRPLARHTQRRTARGMAEQLGGELVLGPIVLGDRRYESSS
jgi:hypothetical protein